MAPSPHRNLHLPSPSHQLPLRPEPLNPLLPLPPPPFLPRPSRSHRPRLRRPNLIRQLRSAIYGLGIRKGDVVLIFSPNSVLFPISFLSIVSLGAIVTTINPQYTVPELKQQVLDSGTELVLTVPDLVPKASSLNLPIILLAKNTNTEHVSFPTFYDLVKNQAQAEFTPPAIKQDDTAALLYFSGTTGESKGVVLYRKPI